MHCCNAAVLRHIANTTGFSSVLLSNQRACNDREGKSIGHSYGLCAGVLALVLCRPASLEATASTNGGWSLVSLVAGRTPDPAAGTPAQQYLLLQRFFTNVGHAVYRMDPSCSALQHDSSTTKASCTIASTVLAPQHTRSHSKQLMESPARTRTGMQDRSCC
jgi:hypothetical protein